VGFQALGEEVRGDHLRPRVLLSDAVTGIVAPEALGRLGQELEDLPGFERLDGWVLDAAKPVVTAALTTTADEELALGHVRPFDIATSGISAGVVHGTGKLLGSQQWGPLPGIANPRDTARFRGSQTTPRPGHIPAPFVIDREAAPEVLIHRRFGNFYKVASRKHDLFVTRDLSQHGGSFFKLFERDDKGLHWRADLDKWGQWMDQKNKSAIGQLLPLKQLRRSR
jgi:hypothetical protein